LFFLSFVKEVVQFYIPWRTFSLYDILFDLLGIFTGLLVFKVILKNSYKRFKFIGSVFGIGLILPAWKGTFSALVALCILILIDINPFTAFISLIYIYLLHFVLRKDIRDKDPDYFTIDEVAGILPLFFIKTEPFLYVTGYIIFRILDIKKPFFIKKTERIKGFNGVFLDDLLSGIIALIFIYIIKFIFI
jgi:phosphatidylglycerophosphatase A